MDEEMLERIQSKIAFLERANAELSDVVYRQQQEISALGTHLRLVANRLEAVQSEEQQRLPEDERPPHY